MRLGNWLRYCKPPPASTHHIPGFGSFTGPVGPSSQSLSWVNSVPLKDNSEFDVIVIGGGHAGLELFVITHFDHSY